MNPTEAQIKRLWEWCGLHYYPDCECLTGHPGVCWGESEETYGKNGNWHFAKPPLDLNNLFKYAVPKLGGLYDIRLQNTIEGWYCSVRKLGFYQDSTNTDPALALFWAINSIIEKEDYEKADK